MIDQGTVYEPPAAKAARKNFEARQRTAKFWKNIHDLLAGINWRGVLIVFGVIILIGGAIALFFAIKQAPPINFNTTPAQGTSNLWNIFGSDAIHFTIKSVPQNIRDMAPNWLGWIILVSLVWLLIGNFKSETTDRNEPKDFRAVVRAFLVCLGMFFLADAIAMKILQICQFTNQGCIAQDIQYWTTIILRAMGAAFLIGSGFAAAAGGNWDASPVSIAIFMTGVLVKISWPGAGILGDVAIVAGILIHIYEIARHKDERASALAARLITILVSVVVGILVVFGANSIAPIAPYRLIIGFAAMILTGLGTSSTVQHKVGAVLPGTFRENLQDVPGTIYFDMKLIVLMVAITYLIIG